MQNENYDGDFEQLTPSMARAMIRTLVRGTTISEGVKFIQTGHEKWILAQRELLEEIGEDGHSDTKFVRGAYGAGKNYFLSVVQYGARQRGWVTSHVECKVDGVQIDRFETLYPQIVFKMVLPNKGIATTGEAKVENPLRLLMEEWAHDQLRQIGIKDGVIARPFDAEVRLYSRLESGVLRSNLSPDFIRASCAFARSLLSRDYEVAYAIGNWVGGLSEKLEIPRRYLQKPTLSKDNDEVVALKPIRKGTAVDAMRGVLWLVRSAGYKGLVLCIDEVEELAKLSSKGRIKRFRPCANTWITLEERAGLAIFACISPHSEMFVGENYFPRYDALATRIQPVGSEINWRAPIVDLDRTPLDNSELLQMANKICRVHRKAYSLGSESGLPEQVSSEIAKKVSELRFRVAKPRLLARVIVDFLERRRLGTIGEFGEISQEINGAATILAKETAV